jgi:hypothetical protein
VAVAERNAAGTGLSRTELEYELRWLMRRMPTDPAKIAPFLGEVVVTLIDKNNQALAAGGRDPAGDDHGEF